MFDQTLLDFVGQHFDFYKKLNDNKDLKRNLVDDLFSLIYKQLKNKGKDEK